MQQILQLVSLQKVKVFWGVFNEVEAPNDHSRECVWGAFYIQNGMIFQ